MADAFSTFQPNLEPPARRHAPITPHNTNPVDPLPRAIKCISDGDAVIEDVDGTVVTYPMTAGEELPFRAYIVRTTTIATLVAWW
jgi:hypothetical protein